MTRFKRPITGPVIRGDYPPQEDEMASRVQRRDRMKLRGRRPPEPSPEPPAKKTAAKKTTAKKTTGGK